MVWMIGGAGAQNNAAGVQYYYQSEIPIIRYPVAARDYKPAWP
jgi:hypothetical protein